MKYFLPPFYVMFFNLALHCHDIHKNEIHAHTYENVESEELKEPLKTFLEPLQGPIWQKGQNICNWPWNTGRTFGGIWIQQGKTTTHAAIWMHCFAMVMNSIVFWTKNSKVIFRSLHYPNIFLFKYRRVDRILSEYCSNFYEKIIKKSFWYII